MCLALAAGNVGKSMEKHVVPLLKKNKETRTNAIKPNDSAFNRKYSKEKIVFLSLKKI